MGKRHTKETKQSAYNYFKEGFGSKATASLLGLNVGTVRRWHELYRAGNPDWITSSYAKTDSLLLEKVVQEYQSTPYGLHALSVRYGISASTILRGHRNYINYGTVTLPKRRGTMKKLRQRKQALGRKLDELDGKGVQGGMFHTDQGFLYTHPIFRERLESMGLVQSLSRKGNCLDNAVIESFNGTMKCEWFYPRFGKGRWNLTFEQAAKMVKEYVRYYNEERIQKKLGYLTPVQYREKIALLLE